jgi:hypothetical protein
LIACASFESDDAFESDDEEGIIDVLILVDSNTAVLIVVVPSSSLQLVPAVSLLPEQCLLLSA